MVFCCNFLGSELVPTRVGMILQTSEFGAIYATCPHTRGDDPFIKNDDPIGAKLVPTRVGMIPGKNYRRTEIAPCPHTRGDDPDLLQGRGFHYALSPHAWG